MSTLEPVIAFHRNKDGKVNWRNISIALTTQIDPIRWLVVGDSEPSVLSVIV